MQKCIYQDERFAEEFCNFHCAYCGGYYKTEYSLKKDDYHNSNELVNKK